MNQFSAMRETKTSGILGLHHITAIAGNAQRNYHFYTKTLGLRLVKKTVNFDDPQTYHLYYGNERGEPGTILTFFPWQHVKQGMNGTGMATEIGYAVPMGSLDYWVKHFDEKNVKHSLPAEKFGEQFISFTDPDGLKLNLIEPGKEDLRVPWQSKEIDSGAAIRGFHNVVLTLKDIKATAGILTDVFGYKLLKQEANIYRFGTGAVEYGSMVDMVEQPIGQPGHVAGGTNHHVAFRVKNEEDQMAIREILFAMGMHITHQIDRNYFFSVYFREPGGVLFEIATENPGFAVDEPIPELGLHLKLPEQYESDRKHLEAVLPPLINE
jgi:glyoxalase family protein